MNLDDLRQHVDTRLDVIERKLDRFAEKTSEHSADIKNLQGTTKLLVSIVLAAAGFFATAYFQLKGH